MTRSTTITRVAFIGALCLGASVLVGCGKSVDGDSIESAISGVLTEQTGATFTVTCPDGLEAKTGLEFECTAVGADGTSTTVKAVMADDNGKFDITSFE